MLLFRQISDYVHFHIEHLELQFHVLVYQLLHMLCEHSAYAVFLYTRVHFKIPYGRYWVRGALLQWFCWRRNLYDIEHFKMVVCDKFLFLIFVIFICVRRRDPRFTRRRLFLVFFCEFWDRIFTSCLDKSIFEARVAALLAMRYELIATIS